MATFRLVHTSYGESKIKVDKEVELLKQALSQAKEQQEARDHVKHYHNKATASILHVIGELSFHIVSRTSYLTTRSSSVLAIEGISGSQGRRILLIVTMTSHRRKFFDEDS